jgi:hypothetical protein
VIGYLTQDLHAMDTLEGIAEWRLAGRIGRVDLRALAGVLQRLVEHGVLDEFRTGKQTRHRLRPNTPPS